MGADKQTLLLESLRVLKKGGVCRAVLDRNVTFATDRGAQMTCNITYNTLYCAYISNGVQRATSGIKKQVV